MVSTARPRFFDRPIASATPARPVALVLILGLIAGLLTSPAPAADSIAERLRLRIESGLDTDSFDVMDEHVFARETLRRIYPARDYAPIWIAGDELSENAKAFIDWLQAGPTRQGLRAEDYHLAAIESLDTDQVGALVDMELALSDAFLIVGSHFLAGRLNPETLDPEWVANRRSADLAPVLERVAAGADAGMTLEELLPRAAAYAALVRRLAELRHIRDAGGWPVVEPGPTLRPGDTGARVAALSERLRISGDLDGEARDVFDAELAGAVEHFQARHGLGADGLVGRATLAELNVPVQDRIDQIIVNLERWRWLPESLGDRYVIVNIAGFRLDVVEDGQRTLTMRVVVGKPYRRTPVFSENIRYLVLNPTWDVPNKIAVEDKLPLIRKDPGYLVQQGFELLEGWGADERRIDPATVDWSAITRRAFPFRLRQPPGPNNALGRIKFMFPNKFSVYLHDTPTRNLFGETSRAFSSGCIRLQEPLELATLLLRDNPNWTRSAIEGAIAQGSERTVMLKQPMPVHLLYWTAWVELDGTIEFRDDIYGRDKPVLRELSENPPS
ncbi:MAG: L,D-transpeptidase family protein [Woeseiaceae bacterium]